MLGWAFKKDTGDSEFRTASQVAEKKYRGVWTRANNAARESPAISIANHFLSEKARITIYDPQVGEDQIWLDLTE